MENKVRAKLTHELALCAIFRNEAPFLDEWITFHAGIGATHFFLYNNFSDDNYQRVLAPWITRGIVTLIDWPLSVGQLSAYRDCVRRARRTCTWVAFIDIDEFMFAPHTKNVLPILREYSGLPGIEIWQLFFGSNGHAARPNVRVTEAYTMRARIDRTSVKTVANPRFIYKVGVHQFKFWQGQALDVARRHVVPGMTPKLSPLRINHYWSRSIEDLKIKIARGDASTDAQRQHDWHLAFEQTLNVETDESIIQIAREIHSAPTK